MCRGPGCRAIPLSVQARGVACQGGRSKTDVLEDELHELRMDAEVLAHGDLDSRTFGAGSRGLRADALDQHAGRQEIGNDDHASRPQAHAAVDTLQNARAREADKAALHQAEPLSLP